MRHGIVLATSLLITGLSAATPVGAAGPELVLQAASAENLAKPHDIVLSPDGKYLYVADNDNDRIVVLEPVSLAELGTFGEEELAAPHDVVFDDRGRLLVADTRNHRIAVYDVDGSGGRLVDSIEGPIRAPEGVAVHRDGRIYATGARSGNLVVFADGRVVGEVGGFSSPHDVEFDTAGRAWVADSANDRMVRVGGELEFVRILDGDPYDFDGPRYMDFDDAGRMYVADKYSNQVKIIAPDGTLLKVIGTPGAGKGEGVFDRPEGVEIRGRDVWFADTYNDRIVRYRITAD